jgi:Zn-dependent protease with chaperone function
MNLLPHSFFMEALGWSLIDSLWQMGFVWLFYVIVTVNGAKYTAAKRHNLAFIAVFAGTAWFFVSVLFNYRSALNNEPLYSLAWLIENGAGSSFLNYGISGQVPRFISYLYAPVAALYFLKVFYQLYSTAGFYRKALQNTDPSFMSSVQGLCDRLHIKRQVLLGINEKVESPLTSGFWKPVIILPLAALADLSYSQVEAIIAHELVHIKRNDFLANLLLKFCDAIMFFNPFARLLIKEISRERENRCDDQVIALGFDAWDYSHALYLIGRHHYAIHQMSIAATGTGKKFLLQRIRRMMKVSNPTPSVLKPAAVFFLCLIAGIFTTNHPRKTRVANETYIPKQATYYYEETRIFITKPIAKEEVRRERKKIEVSQLINAKKQKVDEPEVKQQQVHQGPLIATYVAAPEVIEFTMLDPKVSAVPNQEVCETQQPYIPRSSFYYTEVDTTAGKGVVDL